MIAPSNFLPVVDHGERRLTGFDPGWLVESIYKAARSSGRSMWWAKQVGTAIVYYFRSEDSHSVISAKEINAVVRHVLRQIGAEDVASEFQVIPPRIVISLPCLARESGVGFELVFFERLRGRIHEVAHTEVSALHFHGIRACVKLLSGVRTWRRRCIELETEIVTHIQEIVAVTLPQEGLKLVVN